MHVLHESYGRGISLRFPSTPLVDCVVRDSPHCCPFAAPIRKECDLNFPVMLQKSMAFASTDEN